MEIHHVKDGEVYLANFNIKSEIGNCNDNSGEYTVHCTYLCQVKDFFHDLACSIVLLSTREAGA